MRFEDTCNKDTHNLKTNLYTFLDAV